MCLCFVGNMGVSVALSPAVVCVEKHGGLNKYKPEFRSCAVLPSKKTSLHRRHVLVCGGASLVTILTLNWPLTSSPAWAAEESTSQADKDETVVDAIKSLFDPDEKTKSGKVLPKAYLKSAREVVKTLRESVNEDPKDNAKFRRTADAAKASIRDYLGNWRGNQIVVKEESYVMLEKAIRSLASFYSKAGPSAALPEEVKSDILYDLNTAEESL
ncbi:hypothetical protein AG4045_030601 [Apium graveolens]|uniref:Photosystem II D1 processing protein PSB27-H2, chloroplastic n=2 Tax=Apium graveolens TaxID=4045 RepID=A0A6L5BA09_APIGR|nr:hypothetical protein AG4045_030601 [Apium graveolens]